MVGNNQYRRGFVGNIGERKEFVVTFKDSHSWLQDNYTKTAAEVFYCYKFEDVIGNTFAWVTNLSLKMETYPGEYISVVREDEIKLSGVIKEYREYRGKKEIMLSKCKVVAIKHTEDPIRVPNFSATDFIAEKIREIHHKEDYIIAKIKELPIKNNASYYSVLDIKLKVLPVALFNKRLKPGVDLKSVLNNLASEEFLTRSECKEIDFVYERMLEEAILKESKDGKLAKLTGVKGDFLE